MKHIAIGIGIMLALLIAIAPAVQANDKWEATCVGNTLIQNVTITVGNDVIPIEQNVTCPYGCDSGRRQCYDYSGAPGVAIPLIMFILFLLIGWGLLAWSFLATDTISKLISGVFAAILLFVLGLLSLNVMGTDGIAMSFVWLGWLNFALGFLAVAMVIYAGFLHFKEELT